MAGPLSQLNIYRAVLVLLVSVIAYFMAVGVGPLTEGHVGRLMSMDLKGAGWLGYRLGYAEAVLLLAAQVYLFRPGFISKPAWLDIHCQLTTVGGVLIQVHAGFPYSFGYWTLPRMYPELGVFGLVGLQGVASWLVLALIASGFFGRYIYRKAAQRSRAFRWWHSAHAITSGLLYVTGFIHLLLAVQLRYLTA